LINNGKKEKFVEKEDHLQREVVLLCHRPQALAFVFLQERKIKYGCSGPPPRSP